MANNNIYSISTEEVCPKNEKDTKCAPGVIFEHGSCIRLEILILFVRAYNQEFPDNVITLDTNQEIKHQHKYKKYLVSECNKRLTEKCKTQKCWTRQNFIRRMPQWASEELEKYTFRPLGTHDTTWLNTDNIDQTMVQYERKYKDFKYFGTFPRDLQKQHYKITDEMMAKEINNGKIRFGLIFNTDYAKNGGEHWNSLFWNVKENEILFFDSYGVPPNPDTIAFMDFVEQFMIKYNKKKKVNMDRNHINFAKNGGNKIRTDFNRIRAQQKGSECGVYSINFILRMLRGDSFEKICKSQIPDDVVNKCRKVYFYGKNDK